MSNTYSSYLEIAEQIEAEARSTTNQKAARSIRMLVSQVLLKDSRITELEALQAAPPAENLRCKSVQKRLATMWGYVPAQEHATQLAGQGQSESGALVDVVQHVFDTLQDKIDARGPISKGNLQYYVGLLREAHAAAPAQAQEHVAQQELSLYFDEWEQILPQDAREALRAIVNKA